MDAHSGLAALLGRARTVLGPAAGSVALDVAAVGHPVHDPGRPPGAVARAAADATPAPMAEPLGGGGARDLPPALPMPAAPRRRGRLGDDGSLPVPGQGGAEARAAGADRPPVPDQPGYRPAALRRPAPGRGRRAGQRVGGRGRTDAHQGSLGPDAQHRLRLHSARRRRPGLQQGHHDRAERQLLLWRCRPVGGPPHDRCDLPAPGHAAGPELRTLGHPDCQERRPAPDRRRLLPGAPVPGDVRRRPLLRRAGPRPGRADRAAEQGAGPPGRGRAGPEHARRPRAAGRLGARRSGGCRAPT